MTRIGLFIVVLALVAVPWLGLRAEDETSEGVLAAGAPPAPEIVPQRFRSPGSPPGTLFLQRRLEAPPRPLLRRTETCLAQASPGAPDPGRSTPGGPPRPRSLCEVGVEISRMAPCTSPQDCPAHELWSSGLGAPGLRPARPDRGPRTLLREPPDSPGDDR